MGAGYHGGFGKTKGDKTHQKNLEITKKWFFNKYRLCHSFWLIFNGKTLRNTMRIARLQTMQVCALTITHVFLVFSSLNHKKLINHLL